MGEPQKEGALATLFVVKDKMFINTKRILVFTEKFLFSFEGEVVKFKLAYRDIQKLGPGNKQNSVMLKSTDQNELYISETPKKRDECLSLLYDFKKRMGKKGDEKPIHVIQRKYTTEEEVETLLVISNVDIEKCEGERAFSSKLIKDISSLYSVEEKEIFVIEYGDGRRSFYRCQGEPAVAVLNHLKQVLHVHYSRELQLKQSPLQSLIPPSVELSPDDRLFGFPVKKYNRRLNTTQDRILCLTKKDICLCDSSKVVSSHPIADILIIRVANDDQDRFSIEYVNSSKDYPSVYFSSGRDTIIANIREVTNQSDSLTYDLSGTEAQYFIRGSYSIKLDQEMEEYFLRRLAKLTIKSPDIKNILKEFSFYVKNNHILQNKDKRGLQHITDMILVMNNVYEKDVKNMKHIIPLIIDLFQIAQRFLNSKVNYSELRGVKDIGRVIEDGLRSSDPLIATSAAHFLLRIIEQPKIFDPKNPKYELANKAFILSSDSTLVSSLLSLLVQNVSQEEKSILFISGLLEIYVSILSSHFQTTDRAWFNTFLPKLSRGSVLNSIFELCRSSCFAIAIKATSILKVILTSNAAEIYTSVQDASRQQLALLYQIYQAIDSRYTKQRKVSAELIGLMVEGNRHSMNLIKRIFPIGILRFLNQGQQQQQQQQKGREEQIQKQRTKQNWSRLFEVISRDWLRPDLVWNVDTRKELAAAIQAEITLFERDKEFNKDTIKVWNHEEFVVTYPSLEKLLIVDNVYLSTLLLNSEDYVVKSPQQFLQMIFHKLLLEEVSENRVIYLQSMSWCYAKYQKEIGHVSYMGNVIRFLADCFKGNDLSSVISIFEFLLIAFKRGERNVKLFIQVGGISVSAQVIRNTFKPPLDLSLICTARCLNVLLQAVNLVHSVDEKGCIKIPVPIAKRELTNPSFLPYIVQTLLAKSHEVVNNAARVLERLLDKNSSIAENLHRQTGILYFILYYSGDAGESMGKLLQTLTSQQDPNLIRMFVPDSMALFLQNADSTEFSSVFFGDGSSPQVIWTRQMRNILTSALDRHIAPFLETLERDPSALYVFRDIEPIIYPGLDRELRCGNYYIRNLLESPEWEVECPEEVIRDAIKLLSSVNKSEQVLLLKACSVLFKNKKYRIRPPFRNFEAFPTILRILDMDRSRPDLSPENIDVINAATELIFLTVWTSNANLTTFLDLKGLSTLCTLLSCCSRNIHEGCFSILVFVLKIVCKLAPSPNARDQVAKNPEIMRDILSCLIVGQPADIVSLSMQCLIEFSQDGSLADCVYKHGGHYYLLDFILSFDPTVDITEQNLQVLQNELAARACMALGNISGIYRDEGKPTNPTEVKLQSALTKLLTKGMVQNMRINTEFKFLELLGECYETPESIWNESTRNELALFIKKRIQHMQRSFDEEPDVLDFRFSCHSQEIHVNGIFLKVYRNQPDWKIENPREFLTALFNELRLSTGSQLGGKLRNEDELESILVSIYHVLNGNQGLERFAVSPDALKEFFSFLQKPNMQIQSIVLSIFLLATSNQACVDELCYPERLQFLCNFLKLGNTNRSLLLDVLCNMATSSSKAVIGITTSGILLFLLDYISNFALNKGNKEESAQLRLQSATLLKQLKVASLVDTRFIDITSYFYPRYLILLLERPVNDFLSFYDRNTSNPDIIWNDQTRELASKQITSELNKYWEASEGGTPGWETRYLRHIDYSLGQLQVAGVYIEIYNQQPKYRLCDPRRFMDEIIPAISSIALKDPSGSLLSYILALANFLTVKPEWVHYLSEHSPSNLQQLFSILQDTQSAEIQSALVKVFGFASHSNTCIPKFVNLPNVIPSLLREGVNAQIEEISLRIINLLTKREAQFIKQLCDHKAVPLLIAISDKQTNAAKLAQAILKTMVTDRRFGSTVKPLLGAKEQQLQDAGKIKPEWLQFPLSLNLNGYKPFVPQFESDSLSGASSQQQQQQRPNPQIQRASSNALLISQPQKQNQSPQKITPLARDPSSSLLPPQPAYSPQPTYHNNDNYNNNNNDSFSSPPIPPAKPLSSPSFDQSSEEINIISNDHHHYSQPDNNIYINNNDNNNNNYNNDYNNGEENNAPMPPPKPMPISSAGGPPPPPPPPPPAALSAPPKPLVINKSSSSSLASNDAAGASGGVRDALLDSIRNGTALRKVTPISQEERKQNLQEASIKNNAKDGLMNALAGALAARRTRIVTDLVANPFGDADDDEWDE